MAVAITGDAPEGFARFATELTARGLWVRPKDWRYTPPRIRDDLVWRAAIDLHAREPRHKIWTAVPRLAAELPGHGLIADYLSEAAKSPGLDEDRPRYVTTADLIADTHALVARLPPLRRVYGIARSGMIPASVIACALSAELWSVDIHRGVAIEVGTGFRMGAVAIPPDAPSLVIDDSAYTGVSLERAMAIVAQHEPTAAPLKAAVYSSRKLAPRLDLHAATMTHHVFEWNLGAAPYSDILGFDLDGVLCRDFTAEEDDDGERYLAAMLAMRPSPIRIRRPAAIITARLVRYRQETEFWLRRHGHLWRSLDLGPWSSRTTRTFGRVADWKAERIIARSIGTFVESCPHLAMALARRTGRLIACSTTRELHVPGPS